MEVHCNGDNHIQNFNLGRYIIRYTFVNHVLRLRSRVPEKLNFRSYIRRYTSPNKNFEYSYPLIVFRCVIKGLHCIFNPSDKFKSCYPAIELSTGLTLIPHVLIDFEKELCLEHISASSNILQAICLDCHLYQQQKPGDGVK